MISDYRAYSLFFRFVSNRTANERTAIRAYLQQIFIDRTTGSHATQAGNAQAYIDNLIAAAQEFYIRTHDIDLKTNNTADAQAASLREKERICAEIIGSLVTRLGPAGADSVRLHVEAMKRKMKLVGRAQ